MTVGCSLVRLCVCTTLTSTHREQLNACILVVFRYMCLCVCVSMCVCVPACLLQEWSQPQIPYAQIPRNYNIYRVGQNHIYTVYIRYFWQGITQFTVIYGAYIRFWPTLHINKRQETSPGASSSTTLKQAGDFRQAQSWGVERQLTVSPPPAGPLLSPQHALFEFNQFTHHAGQSDGGWLLPHKHKGSPH